MFLFSWGILLKKTKKGPFESLTMVRFQEENGCYNPNLGCNQTINQFGVEDLVLVLKKCEILTHSQQQPHVPNAHKKKPTIRLTTRVTMLWAPKGPFFTSSWSQLWSSARHTLSNQQPQLKQLRLVNLTENDAKANLQAPSQGFLGFLVSCFENALTQTYCYFVVKTINVSID